MSRGSRIFLPKLQLDPVQLRRGVVPGRSPFGPRQFSDGEQLTAEEASPAPQGRRAKHAIPPEYIGDPIHLTASVVGLNAGSAGAGVNVKALVNPGPGAMEIRAIKFRLRSTVAAAGGVVSCRLDLGDFQLTNGFIPVYAFGRAENLIAEQTIGGIATAEFYSSYIAKLRRPIYVPAGAAIRPQFQHRGQTNAAIDVHVSLLGRMLPTTADAPETLKLPFWAAYIGKSFTLGTADTDVSSENDLANPFDTPLEIERFVGRINYYTSSTNFTALVAATTELESGGNTGLFSLDNSSGLGDAASQILCSIVDSNGFPIAKKLTPLRLLFDAETRSWPVEHRLPPSGYYIVSLANLAWLVATPLAAGSLFAQPCISMLGWREIA